MNTIKIYLKTSGSISELFKDFNLYMGSYQNKVIDVYVPKSILYSNENNTYINAVKIGAISTAPNGDRVTTNSYYLDFVQEKTESGIVYEVYEAKIPKEFVVYNGVTDIVTNVVNIDNTDSENPVILQVITTQTCQVDVLESAYLSQEEVIDPTQLELINGELGNLDQRVTTNTTNIGINTANITDNTQDIATNTEDIAELRELIVSGETYIGSFSGASLPTDEQLASFVFNNTNPSREPKGNDTIIFILLISGATDKNYKYIYNGTTWSHYELPAIEKASNGTYGIIEGTYNIGSANNTIVDIINGQILNIYVKDNDSTLRNVREYLNTTTTNNTATNTRIDGIINGTTSVGVALKSVADALGNNIVSTYLTQNIGASKQYVKDYSLPKVFNDIYYITAGGYTLETPTLLTPQFTATTSSVGDFEVFTITKDVAYNYELSKKNSSQNNIYIGIQTPNEVGRNLKFRLTTKAKKQADEDYTILSVELTPLQTYAGNGQTYKVSFSSAFNSLNNEVMSLTDGDTIQQVLEVVTETSESTTINIYSNETFPSIFNLNTQTMSIVVGQGLLGEQPVILGNGILENNVLTFDLEEDTILNNNTECEFKLTYADNTTLNDNVEVQVRQGEQLIRLATPYNMLTGNATIGYLKQVGKYNADGQTWVFKGFVNNSEILVDMDNISEKQDTLISGTNIKTINGTSILGSGNIDIDSGGATITWRTW